MGESCKGGEEGFDGEGVVKGMGVLEFDLYERIWERLNAGGKGFGEAESLAGVGN